MGAQGAAECTKPARDACSTASRCATIPIVEIVNVRITTITDDNVARRCDGCLEVIGGTRSNVGASWAMRNPNTPFGARIVWGA